MNEINIKLTRSEAERIERLLTNEGVGPVLRYKFRDALQRGTALPPSIPSVPDPVPVIRPRCERPVIVVAGLKESLLFHSLQDAVKDFPELAEVLVDAFSSIHGMGGVWLVPHPDRA